MPRPLAHPLPPGAPKPLALLSTDLDGTLLDFQRGVPVDPAFFERVARYKELYHLTWVLNTGRWWDSLAI